MVLVGDGEVERGQAGGVLQKQAAAMRHQHLDTLLQAALGRHVERRVALLSAAGSR